MWSSPGERGLAGGYNNNIFKAVAAHSEETAYCVLPLGRKAMEKYAHLGAELLSDQYPRVESISVGSCYAMAKRLIEGYTNEEFDEIWLAYTSFQSMMTQEVQLEQLLPIRKPETSEPLPVSAVYELEPAETLKAVMPDFLAGRLYSALCDSFASEVASRRNAMDSATKNAGEMIDGCGSASTAPVRAALRRKSPKSWPVRNRNGIAKGEHLLVSSQNIGKVVQIIGPVLDIRFEDGCLPELLNAIEIQNGDKKIVAEVAR